MLVRGIGVQKLHRVSGYSAGYISQLRSGLRTPSADTARDLDDALGANGTLARLAPAEAGQEHEGRIAQAGSRPPP
jgi:transcriptional regulator with XRE-family HTH domain